MSSKDYEILRGLGARLKEISEINRENNIEQLKSWKDINGLRKSRPMFMIDQIPWNEMNINDELTLQCSDPVLRGMEDQLRKQILGMTTCLTIGSSGLRSVSPRSLNLRTTVSTRM